MRKWVMVFLSIMLVVSLSGCGNTDKSSENNSSGNATGGSRNITTKDARVLIVYFTAPEDAKVSENDAVAGASIVVKDGEKMGSTEYVAGLVQETVGGDLFRIETKDAYPLEHDTLVEQAAEEQKNNLRPELSSHVENFEQYDTVILGFPSGGLTCRRSCILSLIPMISVVRQLFHLQCMAEVDFLEQWDGFKSWNQMQLSIKKVCLLNVTMLVQAGRKLKTGLKV